MISVFLPLIPSLVVGQTKPVSDAQIIKLAKEVHQPIRQTTVFCQLPYNDAFLIELNDSEYVSEQSRRVNWRRIVSTSRLMILFDCQSKYCHVDKHRSKVKRHCLSHDLYFAEAYSDLHNIIPVLPKISRALETAQSYQRIENENEFNPIACGLSWQEGSKSVILSNCLAGFIARAHLYMQDKYELDISLKERLMYLRMHKACPPDEWERAWNQQVFNIQGHSNPYIERLMGSHD